MQTLPLSVGMKLKLWFAGTSDGISRVIDIMPYRGKLDFVWCEIRCTAFRTKRGYIDMTVPYGDVFELADGTYFKVIDKPN